MPFQSVGLFNFPEFGVEPLYFRGRTTAQPASGVLTQDVYSIVFQDILDNIGSDILSWCYYINWHVRTSVTSVNNANLSTFRGARLRRNLGIIQYGTQDGTADDDVIRYNNQSHRRYSFLASNRFGRQAIAVPTSATIPRTEVVLLAIPGVPFTPTSFFNLNLPNGSISALPHADTFAMELTSGVNLIYTIHYVGVLIQISNATLSFDGYV